MNGKKSFYIEYERENRPRFSEPCICVKFSDHDGRNRQQMSKSRKKIFLEFYELEKKKKQLMNEIRELEEVAVCIGSPSNFQGVKVKSSGSSSSRHEKVILKIEAKREELISTVHKLDKKQKQIVKMIESLESISEQTVMRYRYINGMKFAEIAKRINYSESHVYYMHQKAMNWITHDKSK